MKDLYDPAVPGPYAVPDEPVTLAPIEPAPIRRRRFPRLRHAAGDTAAAIVGLCAGLFLLGLWWSASNNDGDPLQFADDMPGYPASVSLPAPTAAKPGKPVEQAPRSVLAGDGLWEVGRDFKPGVFSSTTPGDSFCYVERLDPDGHLLESFTFQAGRPAVITVKPGDRWALVSGCGSWKRVK